MESNYLEKYFDTTLSNLKNHFDNSDFDEKERIKMRIELLNEIRENLSWQINTPEQKQSLRIQSLASMRKSGALVKFINKKEKCIKFYELTTSSFPYVLALDTYSSQKELLNFCKDYCNKIDFVGTSFLGDLPNIDEIEAGFKSYFESMQRNKSDLFEECYDKIDKLYNRLKIICCQV